MAYDPMTLLVPEAAAQLGEWLRNESPEDGIELPNATISGGALRAHRDDEGVWITPVP